MTKLKKQESKRNHKDELSGLEKEIQKVTDDATCRQMTAHKEKELMEV